MTAQRTPALDIRAAALESNPYDFSPANEDEYALAILNPFWRISHLYKILVKDDDDEDPDSGLVQQFRPNKAQRELLESFHYRTIILKARQLGYTTLIAILFLDCCLFRSNVRAGMIAQTEPIAQKLFRDKVKFAYDNLPDDLKAEMPLERRSADELLFEHNGSSIWVSVSMRSGTLQYLHVSEFGKICAKAPDKAEEIVTGALPTVPEKGLIFIESTAEGRAGYFYDYCERARNLMEAGRQLSNKQFKFVFTPWHSNPEYQIDPSDIIISSKDHEYFNKVEAEMDVTLSMRQRAWYVVTRDDEQAGNEEMMWREYPSTPTEPFMVSNAGAYFAKQITAARRSGRIVPHIPYSPGIPCWTFWDIGNTDGTAIWVMQRVGLEFRLINFYEAWSEPYSHAVSWLRSKDYSYEMHYLPHDGDHHRQGQTRNMSPREMLEELMPHEKFDIVDRIEDITWGINQTRDVFPHLWIDETACKEGLIHLELYSKKWNKGQKTWGDYPDKTSGHSEAADALRQFAQAYHNGMINTRKVKKKSRKGGNWRVA